MRLKFFLLALALLSSPAAFAKDSEAHQPAPPVYTGDVARPYVVLGEIRDNLRKHFAFQADPTKEKIYAEIWERARKMGADAVINARYGATEKTPFNHGRTPISGTAVRFVDRPPAP
jgi:hypothetical protein